jgi:hypothetical protein
MGAALNARPANRTGLPDRLKAGVEALSGVSMDRVKVHYNSARPAQFSARAYAQGTDIHLAPGQEQHLPHEAWHVAQQAQGRVGSTARVAGGLPINDDAGLEREADVMGARALSHAGAVAGADTLAAPQPGGAPALQRKAYTVSRRLPLEPHFGEWKNTAPASARDIDDTEKAKADILGKLRKLYPLSAQDQAAADLEKWDGERRDEHRGPAYAQKKLAFLSRLPMGGINVGFWTRGAHVAGLSVASERERANTPESKLTEKVTGMNWIGAHLIKREWGGEDNMWNVVCWPKSAEDLWGREFEEPIDIAFAVGGQKGRIEISINVEKDDEIIDREVVQGLIDSALKSQPGAETDPLWLKAIHEAAVTSRAEANRGVESIPTSARAASTLPAARGASLSAGDTAWPAARAAAYEFVKKRIAGAVKSKPAPQRIPFLKDPREVERQKAHEAVTERSADLDKEAANYRSERYEVTHFESYQRHRADIARPYPTMKTVTDSLARATLELRAVSNAIIQDKLTPAKDKNEQKTHEDRIDQAKRLQRDIDELKDQQLALREEAIYKGVQGQRHRQGDSARPAPGPLRNIDPTAIVDHLRRRPRVNPRE